MASDPAKPPAEEPPGASAGPGQSRESSPPAPGAPRQDGERYGPLQLLRTRKDDGRALLLFSRRDGGDGAPTGAQRA